MSLSQQELIDLLCSRTARDAPPRGLEFPDELALVSGELTQVTMVKIGLEPYRPGLLNNHLAVVLPDGKLYAPLVARCTSQLMWSHQECPHCRFAHVYPDVMEKHMANAHPGLPSKVTVVPTHNRWCDLPEQVPRALTLVRLLHQIVAIGNFANFTLISASRNAVTWIADNQVYHIQVYEAGYRVSPAIAALLQWDDTLPACYDCRGCHATDVPCTGLPLLPLTRGQPHHLVPLSAKVSTEVYHQDVDSMVLIRSSTCDYTTVGFLLNASVVIVAYHTGPFIGHQMKRGHRFFCDHNHTVIEVIWARAVGGLLYLERPTTYPVPHILRWVHDAPILERATYRYDFASYVTEQKFLLSEIEKITTATVRRYRPVVNRQQHLLWIVHGEDGKPALLTQGPLLDSIYDGDYIATAPGQFRFVAMDAQVTPAYCPPDPSELPQPSYPKWTIAAMAAIVTLVVVGIWKDK